MDFAMHGPEMAELQAVIAQMIEENGQRGFGSLEILRGKLLQLIGPACRRHEAELLRLATAKSNITRRRDALFRVTRYIRENLAQDLLVQCCMLDGTNKNDGFLARARRKPQRYRGIARICNAALAEKTRFYVPDSMQHCTSQYADAHRRRRPRLRLLRRGLLYPALQAMARHFAARLSRKRESRGCFRLGNAVICRETTDGKQCPESGEPAARPDRTAGNDVGKS